MSEDLRLSAKGDVFETNDRILRLGKAKIGACFVFTFALKMKSKMIFGILAAYTIISLGNKLFRFLYGVNDGDWFHRCFWKWMQAVAVAIVVFFVAAVVHVLKESMMTNGIKSKVKKDRIWSNKLIFFA
ncbi:hypothetical protein GCK72_002606 [Caenorhabditis remanei]|uniref:Uncharacterized protein n=1 Tax=Caenorhabditis remanei TaxID=31234 RepID=A0A6A5HWN0_CAERE|nr:hypothetical protein GCK72_002606 [Caenorhabditis remanei]KAF1770783.1 hypothetical protein GCK72_002606 [Caenorhabditis remanei]